MRSSRDVTVYPRVVSWLTTSCANASTKKAILKQLPPLACGDISGAPSNFVYSSMTLESSMWGRNTPCTSRQLYYSTTRSLKIGRVKNSQVLTLNGTLQTLTRSVLAACPSRITSVTYYFEWDTQCPRKNNYRPTSTAKLFMAPNNSMRMSRVRAQVSMRKGFKESNKSWAPACFMEERSTINHR